jgi:hypothetical protein
MEPGSRKVAEVNSCYFNRQAHSDHSRDALNATRAAEPSSATSGRRQVSRRPPFDPQDGRCQELSDAFTVF